MDDNEVREQVAALGASFDRLPRDAAGPIADLMRLYGETLRRVVQAARDNPDVTEALARDELIAQMLLLHDVALQRRSDATPQPQRCDLCSEELADAHAHLFDTTEHAVLCACAVCALLFPQRADAGGRYRFIPEGVTAIEGFTFDELTWSALEIPVGVAYFVRSADGKIVAYYPSPVGAVQSQLKLDAWQELERCNPALQAIAPETQALLVNSGRGSVEGWIVGIDACFRLIAVMRTHWRGLRGGESARGELERFFNELRSNAAAPFDKIGTTEENSHVIKSAL